MTDRVAMVTGANSGVGLEAARCLAQQGLHVVLVCRNDLRGARAIESIVHDVPDARVELLLCDLSSLASVRTMVDQFREIHLRLDVLVNNAGAIFARRTTTPEGHERTFALNHLAPFLLTQLLVDLLAETGDARVVNVASRAHRDGTIDFDDLMGERHYGAWRAYRQSKLANVLFTLELDRRLRERGHDVATVAVHPGLVASSFAQREGPHAWLFRLARPLMKSAKTSGREVALLALRPDLLAVSGGYFNGTRSANPSAEARDPQVARRLWDASVRLTGMAGV